jgi:hypothetical protein
LVTITIMINILGWITTEGVWAYFHFSSQIPEINSAIIGSRLT